MRFAIAVERYIAVQQGLFAGGNGFCSALLAALSAFSATTAFLPLSAVDACRIDRFARPFRLAFAAAPDFARLASFTRFTVLTAFARFACFTGFTTLAGFAALARFTTFARLGGTTLATFLACTALARLGRLAGARRGGTPATAATFRTLTLVGFLTGTIAFATFSPFDPVMRGPAGRLRGRVSTGGATGVGATPNRPLSQVTKPPPPFDTGSAAGMGAAATGSGRGVDAGAGRSGVMPLTAASCFGFASSARLL